MDTINRVQPETFGFALLDAQTNSQQVQQATTPCKDITLSLEDKYFLTDDKKSGFIVSSTGELTSLFSTVSGRGIALVNKALTEGAEHLDCFDGFLTSFYRKFGFKTDRIEANWTPGEPSVHYMSLLPGMIKG